MFVIIVSLICFCVVAIVCVHKCHSNLNLAGIYVINSEENVLYVNKIDEVN